MGGSVYINTRILSVIAPLQIGHCLSSSAHFLQHIMCLQGMKTVSFCWSIQTTQVVSLRGSAVVVAVGVVVTGVVVTGFGSSFGGYTVETRSMCGLGEETPVCFAVAHFSHISYEQALQCQTCIAGLERFF